MDLRLEHLVKALHPQAGPSKVLRHQGLDPRPGLVRQLEALVLRRNYHRAFSRQVTGEAGDILSKKRIYAPKHLRSTFLKEAIISKLWAILQKP